MKTNRVGNTTITTIDRVRHLWYWHHGERNCNLHFYHQSATKH